MSSTLCHAFSQGTPLATRLGQHQGVKQGACGNASAPAMRGHISERFGKELSVDELIGPRPLRAWHEPVA